MPYIDRLLNLTRPMPKRKSGGEASTTEDEEIDFDNDPALPGALWTPPDETNGGEANANIVEGGVNYGGDDSGEGADLVAG